MDATPVWFMRQAGRALPEYRKIRERATLLEITRDPALCAEVTLQPVRRLGVDAAILFADITTPLAGLGVAFDIREGVGPVIEHPVRTLADVRGAAPVRARGRRRPAAGGDPADPRASRRCPLIGFAGAPFTLACYLVEGGPSRDFLHTKRLMHAEPETWAALLDRLVDATIAYLARAGGRRAPRPSRCSTPGSAGLSPLDYERRLLAVDAAPVRRASRRSASRRSTSAWARPGSSTSRRRPAAT